MFGVGLPELIVILVIALLIFGPKGLPEVGRTVGGWIREIKNSVQGLSDEVKDSLNIDIPYEDIKSHEPPPRREETDRPEGSALEGRSDPGGGPDADK